MQNEVLIAPSLLAGDFANLERDLEMLNQSEADWIHLDIMDGVFVPNISFGMPVCKAIQKLSKKPLDYHLMIVEPQKYLSAFKDLGADTISVHLEACPHLHRTIQEIKALGCKAGVALNPHTSIQALEEILSEIDLVCLMSVNPGFGGQQFIPNSLDKIRRLRTLANEKGSDLRIEVDGGVNATNFSSILQAGADVLVAGSAVFGADDPLATIKKMKLELT